LSRCSLTTSFLIVLVKEKLTCVGKFSREKWLPNQVKSCLLTGAGWERLGMCKVLFDPHRPHTSTLVPSNHTTNYGPFAGTAIPESQHGMSHSLLCLPSSNTQLPSVNFSFGTLMSFPLASRFWIHTYKIDGLALWAACLFLHPEPFAPRTM